MGQTNQTNQANQGDAIVTSSFIGPNAGMHMFSRWALAILFRRGRTSCKSIGHVTPFHKLAAHTREDDREEETDLHLAGARLDDRPLEGVQDGWGPQVSETRCMSWHVAAPICTCWVSEPRAL
ncbi:uncharacterized protein VDAG_08725 [Verticillium dahliae VdLs.17]|uniref:Uncharacterized protein n=1 Tax=Verticillium dahliae (strain VdLs.17 / ATCC MYA-4575 / FGSC 10137) TaxID=498257 RepID=G2XEZ3_VERDV|nr:uncharacterized protein VDAG_08725 [Verticillium dahliae VdLs.17]EGY18391.1 hypothetical protein VDAG_08725 [Verticillium dahliae VdLs.17]KAH6686505.1 hypothetical protein EV126DRAFT_463766 [Verticillium dahliae]